MHGLSRAAKADLHWMHPAGTTAAAVPGAGLLSGGAGDADGLVLPLIDHLRSDWMRAGTSFPYARLGHALGDVDAAEEGAHAVVGGPLQDVVRVPTGTTRTPSMMQMRGADYI